MAEVHPTRDAIHLGERPSIVARESFQLIAAGRRGGYCFHLNGALSELLADAAR